MLDIRPGAQRDLEGINELYNRYVRGSPATFDITEWSIERRLEWFGHYGEAGPYRLFVAADRDEVLGFATSSPHRTKEAYASSIETTVYVAHGAEGRGIGKGLYSALFASLEGEDVHRAYAGVTMPNPASVALHERFGFRQVAYFSEQGRKFGRYWDVAWFEKEM